MGPSPEEGEQQNNGDNAPYLTISELSRAVKTAVENAFDFVRVRAEVSRPNKAPSGHLYFTLKDDRSFHTCGGMLENDEKSRDTA